MSGLDLLRDEDLRTERGEVKEPAKRWFNWWRVKNNGPVQSHGGAILLPFAWAGTELHDGCVWPSRDVAELKASEEIAWWENQLFASADEYLGAFPEGERPE